MAEQHEVDAVVVAATLDAASKMLRPDRMLSESERPAGVERVQWARTVAANRARHADATRLAIRAREIRETERARNG